MRKAKVCFFCLLGGGWPVEVIHSVLTVYQHFFNNLKLAFCEELLFLDDFSFFFFAILHLNGLFVYFYIEICDEFLMAKKIIIVGGGVAGLSAGIYARLNGFDPLILEKHSIAGGVCTAWYRKGYRFDYSIQWLVGTREGAFHQTFMDTNVINDDVKILNADYHTRVVLPSGEDLVVYTDIDKWCDYLISRAPEDERSIKKLRKHMRWSTQLTPFDAAPPLRTFGMYLKALPKTYKLIWAVLRFGRKTYKEYIKSLGFKNDWLRNALTRNYADDKFSALAFLFILSWYTRKNAGYPIGGSLGVAERMHKRFVDLGGETRFKSNVSEIIVENNKAVGVKLDDGTELRADYVISAADGYTTIYEFLKGQYLSEEVKHAYEHWEPYPAIVQISLGVNAKLETQYPVQVILGERKISDRVSINHNYRILNYSFDQTMAPEGKTCIVIRFESPYDLWKGMDKETYEAEKENIKRYALQLLEDNYPGNSSNVEVCDVATPLTTVRYTGAWRGAYEGFKASNRNITKQLSQTLPGLDNFYMVGHWLFPGGGVPPSVHSGKWAMQLICKKEGKEVKFNQ